jgi:hypothetical protein
MSTIAKLLAAAVMSLAAGVASAHVNVRIQAGAPDYYYPPVRVQQYYGPPPVYIPYREVYVPSGSAAKRGAATAGNTATITIAIGTAAGATRS